MRRLLAPCLLAMAGAVALPVAAQAQPASAAPAAVPEARLVVARQISAITVPDGFLRDAYAALMPQMLEATMRAQLGNAQFDAQKKEPGFQERMKRVSEITIKELGDLLSPFEEKLRLAYAAAYGRQFDERQLTEILVFYKTPVGNLFARRSLSLVSDPAIVSLQQEIGPALTDALPGLQEKIKAAIADLPTNTAGARQ